jgi:hypothetical protein
VTSGPDPAALWDIRAEESAQDFARLERLLAAEKVRSRPGVEGRYKFLAGPLVADLATLGKQGYGPVAWGPLAALQRRSTDLLQDHLEFLGGASVADAEPVRNFIGTAKGWLDRLCSGAGVDPVNLVIGRGSRYDSATNLAHLPFLDWDLWHLPLLARMAGLGAVAPRGPYREDLDPLIEALLTPAREAFETGSDAPLGGSGAWLPELRAFLQGFRWAHSKEECEGYREENENRYKELLGRQRRYLEHLFADMLATALVGPTYPWALLVLEFDLATPPGFQAEPPLDASAGRAAESPLPPADHRFAACLAILDALSEAGKPRRFSQGPYDEEVRELRQTWEALTAGAAGTAAPIEPVITAGADWHGALYRVICRRCAQTLPRTAETWRLSGNWRAALFGADGRPNAEPEAADLLTAVVGAMWKCGLAYPERAKQIADEAERAIRGESLRPCETGEKGSIANAVFRIRLERLEERIARAEELLAKIAGPGNRAGSAIAGRILRHLGPLSYDAERCWLHLDGPVRPSAWGRLRGVAEALDLIGRELLEVLGGVLIRDEGLDREDPGHGLPPGPAIGALADRILRDYAGRTGVNWDGRVIFGRDPFLETMTDVIRLRFPDWSLWSLPLLGHEFGHLVAAATPGFAALREREAAHWAETGAEASLQRERQLDECFADVFAAYSCGPAFACAVILLHLSPPEANLPRGAHPSHLERAELVLEVLRLMSDAAQTGRHRRGAYEDVIEILRDSWLRALNAAGAASAEDGAMRQARRRARELFRSIDRHYRLGPRYLPERWRTAKELAQSLAQGALPAAPGHGPLEDCMDLVNALWWLRLEPGPAAKHRGDIATIASKAGTSWLGATNE